MNLFKDNQRIHAAHQLETKSKPQGEKNGFTTS